MNYHQIEGNTKITVQRLAASHMGKSYNQSEHSISKKDSFLNLPSLGSLTFKILSVTSFKFALLFVFILTEMAGYFAARVNARVLVLTHFSQRYKGAGENVATKTSDCDSIEKLLRQAEIAFKSDSVIAADDFMVVHIPLKLK